MGTAEKDHRLNTLRPGTFVITRPTENLLVRRKVTVATQREEPQKQIAVPTESLSTEVQVSEIRAQALILTFYLIIKYLST